MFFSNIQTKKNPDSKRRTGRLARENWAKAGLNPPGETVIPVAAHAWFFKTSVCRI